MKVQVYVIDGGEKVNTVPEAKFVVLILVFSAELETVDAVIGDAEVTLKYDPEAPEIPTEAVGEESAALVAP